MMKTKGFILTILFILLLFSNAFSYEIAVIGDIPLEDRIGALAINHNTDTVIAASSNNKTLYIIDLLSLSVINTLSLPVIPTALTLDTRDDSAIISSSDGMLYFINLDNGSIVKTISIKCPPEPADCHPEPVSGSINALAINPKTDILYIANGNKLIVMDLKTDDIIKETPLSNPVIGMDIDYSLGYLVLLVSSEISTQLSVYNAETIEYISSSILSSHLPDLSTPQSSHIAINPSTHIAVITNSPENSISIISLSSCVVNPASCIVYPASDIGLTEPSAVSIDPTRNIAIISHKEGIVVVNLENPVPSIERLIPEGTYAGNPGLTLSIEGSGFIGDSKARFDLQELTTLYEDNTTLEALIPFEELQSPGDVPVTVLNPPPGGGVSNSLIFRILNPIPLIDSIEPDSAALTNPPVDIKVRGKNFLPNSVVNLNGRNLKTRFISSILLEARLDPSDIKTPAKYPLVVINPSPFSLTSNIVYLNVVEGGVGTEMSSRGEARATTNEILNPAKKDKQYSTGTLRGRILNTRKEPIEGVTVKIKNISTVTDADGYFVLEHVPSGKQLLLIRGKTAKDINSHYPTIPLTVDIKADTINEMPFQIYLHKQKKRNFKYIDHNIARNVTGPEAPEFNEKGDIIVKDPEVPGFEMRIPKGVKITGWDGQPNIKVSVRKVPIDRLPIKPLPPNANVKTVYMFYFDKEGGGTPDQPIPIKTKNDLGLLPGEKAILWYYDESPNEGEAPNEWAIAGTGTVTPDGKYIVSDPGVGIPKFCCGASGFGGTSGGDNSGGCDGSCCFAGGGGSGGGGGGPGPVGPTGTAGDPVDLATGYFLHKKTDLQIPGIIPVNITRYYRSRDSGSAVAGGTGIGADPSCRSAIPDSEGLGAFGKGTYFEYDWWMGAFGADGTIDNTNPTMLLLIKPGNYQYRFIKQADGTFTNDSNPEMIGAVAVMNADGTRSLRTRDGWTYVFDSCGRMIEIEDRNGNNITIERHSTFEGGYIKRITTSEGGTITFNQTYTGNFFRTDSITDHTGRTVYYTYEDDPFSDYPRLKKVTYPDGSSIEYRYDSEGRMSEIINERGIRELLIEYYDTPEEKRHRVYRQTHADGGVYTFDYTIAGGNITETTMTAPNGAVTTWRFYDDEGNFYDKYIVKVTTPDGTTVYERDPATNQILSITDPLGRRTSYTYDSKGRIVSITDNLGNVTTYEYEDTHSNVTRITDALGNVTTMTYDANGNMTAQTTPDGKTTTYTYNSIGKPLTVTDPLGNTTTMEYDASGNLIRITDPLGNISQMAYDALGRMVKMTDAGGNSTYYNYDVMGRIREVIDPLGNTTRYWYDTRGNLVTVKDAKGQEIIYEYDNRDRLIKMIDQLGRVETYTYDTSDNLISVTDRKGQTTTYTYDLMNRITRVDYADGSYTTYSYNSAGRLLAINDSISGNIQYTYSGGDQAVRETTPLGIIDYTYDAIGRRTSMTVAGQPAVNYTYDAGGRLIKISREINGVVKEFNISYDDAGRRVSLTLPNGVTTNYTYDNAGRLLEMKHLDPVNSPLETLNYSYDANGNRISMNRPSVNLPLPNPASNITYNPANQMLTFQPEGGIIKDMVYDENGNLVSVTNSCGTTTYTWDARNRLVAINGFDADCQTLTASFKYDALGRRIEKTIDGVTTQYLYDGQDIIQEKQNGVVTANYIRTLNIDEPLARIKTDGTIRYYQQDALGSVIALTDENGVVKTTYAYDPFGNTTISGESSDNPFQYTGRENDGTGLYYYRARYYSPGLQRFISEDTLECERRKGKNLYGYVKNNPVNFRDPQGLAPIVVPCEKLKSWPCGSFYCCRTKNGTPKCGYKKCPPPPPGACGLATPGCAILGCYNKFAGAICDFVFTFFFCVEELDDGTVTAQ